MFSADDLPFKEGREGWILLGEALDLQIPAEVRVPRVHVLQHHLHVVRVPLALLVAAELGAAVEQTSSHAGLLGVDGRRRDERGGRSGRGTGRARSKA